MADSQGNPYDINGQHFNTDMYIQKLLKESSLKQIMDHESEILAETQGLHSDMQTLVYENYNKFISATDTIKKMKTDFKKMEDEMDLLAANMNSITSFSDQISSTLQESRQKITKLSSIHSLLKKLQFLFKLPAKLKSQIENKQYVQAVQDYTHAQKVLESYGDMASFKGIQQDCKIIEEDLKKILRDKFKTKDASAKDLAESVDLLLCLNEPAESLCDEFLSHAEVRLAEQLEALRYISDQDIMEFVDMCSSGFLSDLSLMIASYNNMFINREQDTSSESLVFAESRLYNFVSNNMEKYFDLVRLRIAQEQETGDATVLVRALDRFHRRLETMKTLLPETDFASHGTEMILMAARRQCRHHLSTLKAHFADSLTGIRQALAAPKLISQDTESSNNLSELVTSLVFATVERVKSVLEDLLIFLQPDLNFSSNPKFREVFCIDNVREELVVGFLHHLTATARGFCEMGEFKFPPTLLLLLSKVCLEFEASSVQYLLKETDEYFSIDSSKRSGMLTGKDELCSNMRAATQQLINFYVRMQGITVSQMIRKSVETRDWLHTIEPRTVRPVMKRVVEDIAAIDSQVGALYEEGQRAERSSDSSRRTHSMSVSRNQYRTNWPYAPSQLESSIVTNIQKLFSERIEIFSSVEFSKVSILTGIIKISLKTFLECVRLRTFSRYGLQQIQVDTHYLQLYLWRFVADENLVHFLLDEILGSAFHRCLDPVLMEPSVVDIICERG